MRHRSKIEDRQRIRRGFLFVTGFLVQCVASKTKPDSKTYLYENFSTATINRLINEFLSKTRKLLSRDTFSITFYNAFNFPISLGFHISILSAKII